MMAMKHIILLLICITTLPVLAQDNAMYEKTTKVFQEHFNSQNVEAIFDLYTSETKEIMTKEGVTRFVNGCYEQFGNLKSLTFIETSAEVNSYTARFEKTSLIMELQLNTEGKISTLQFQEP